MKVCILFYNLGGYHLARLEAAKQACDDRDWQLSAIEITGGTVEHPWGSLDRPTYVQTLIPFSTAPQPTIGDPKLLTNCLNKLKPDVLAVPGWGYDFSRHAIRWARKNDCRLILMSESKRDDAARNYVKEKIKQHLWVNKFDAAIVGGQKHVDYLIDLGMNAEQIFTGYNVVDNEFFGTKCQRYRDAASKQSLRPEFVPPNKFFLAANRFIPRKNLLGLISAFAAAVKSDQLEEEWDLVLLGGGAPIQQRKLELAIDKHQLNDRIHLPGFVEYQDMPKWYAHADVFVHPAHSEQWGLVVNEAMAAGLPIVLSKNCGCHPELVDEGVNGFSFDPENDDELTRALIQIAQSDLTALGNASAHKINEEFSTCAFGDGIVNANNVMSGVSGII